MVRGLPAADDGKGATDLPVDVPGLSTAGSAPTGASCSFRLVQLFAITAGGNTAVGAASMVGGAAGNEAAGEISEISETSEMSDATRHGAAA